MADPVVLEGKLDLATVSALHATLGARLDDDITLDFAKVTQIGALCLQVCLAAARAARAAGKVVSVINLPDPVATQLACMGFDAERLAEGAA
ncbi:STAS domain-containing protein [Marimonas sp. MJW-29]|uniref:STAS domain-containing protein n=1 Tax=Sulfitobacter sediminis TaxID=3234186 RepID=A0ABV3RSU5_9RHOB